MTKISLPDDQIWEDQPPVHHRWCASSAIPPPQGIMLEGLWTSTLAQGWLRQDFLITEDVSTDPPTEVILGVIPRRLLYARDGRSLMDNQLTTLPVWWRHQQLDLPDPTGRHT